jgi:hypothetical protein
MDAEGERDDLQDALDNKEYENTDLNKKLFSKKVCKSLVSLL